MDGNKIIIPTNNEPIVIYEFLNVLSLLNTRYNYCSMLSKQIRINGERYYDIKDGYDIEDDVARFFSIIDDNSLRTFEYNKDIVVGSGLDVVKKNRFHPSHFRFIDNSDFKIIDIFRNNPFEIIVSCAIFPLIAAVILSGGEVSFGKAVRIKLPPIGHGIRKLREAVSNPIKHKHKFLREVEGRRKKSLVSDED